MCPTCKPIKIEKNKPEKHAKTEEQSLMALYRKFLKPIDYHEDPSTRSHSGNKIMALAT
jgi:hypothetical protein